MSRKLIFSAVGVAAMLAVGAVWIVRDVRDVGLWGLWFASINTVIGLYAGANVAQKGVIGKHYRSELDDTIVDQRPGSEAIG